MKTHSPDNERIKRAYFTYLIEAQGFSEATLDSVAKAINRFESYTKFRDFKAFHIEQAKGFKASLAEQMSLRTKDRLSKATLYATLNALRPSQRGSFRLVRIFSKYSSHGSTICGMKSSGVWTTLCFRPRRSWSALVGISRWQVSTASTGAPQARFVRFSKLRSEVPASPISIRTAFAKRWLDWVRGSAKLPSNSKPGART
jgi:hypothetical protein